MLLEYEIIIGYDYNFNQLNSYIFKIVYKYKL